MIIMHREITRSAPSSKSGAALIEVVLSVDEVMDLSSVQLTTVPTGDTEVRATAISLPEHTSKAFGISILIFSSTVTF